MERPAAEVSLRPSAALALVLSAGHGTAAATLFPLDLPAAAKVLLGLALLVSAVASVARHAWLWGSRAWVRLRVGSDLGAELETRAGKRIAGRVLPSTLVHPWLLVVRVAPEGGGRERAVVLLPDSADADGLRALRVVLRWGTAPPPVAKKGAAIDQ
ncbi:protein YgfX [Pelomicrobium sp. G1]|uniref:protein YgfX n=1 Tax=unclassified Pelomicrobium TaxID=2815318 RepID=UPI003479386C